MKNETQILNFGSIKEAARVLNVPHMRIRQWVKQGNVRGFYSGSRFYVNISQLKEALERGDFEHAPNERENPEDEQREEGSALTTRR